MTAKHELRFLFDFFPEDEAFDMLRLKLPRMAKTEAIRDQAIPLDPTVRALGVVSLLNDFSSEVAVRTLPLFLANVLGVRIGIIGLIEGIAESTATF